ncbi:hypothetical protein BCS96_10420 [Vibrio breoganii]|uniref:glycosyltransferase family 2 protein n=1 Tax=Vibrio breoganii TaxID=553239 RepID=UPI000C854E08|nr:glycosyltransferase family 2 protein [Vibrio breoganii]PMJ49941.1 hypothetical protein BCU21_17405 [Vibrio breoganii]PMK63334.1 hypothetical protein BCT97_02185 [Vibrio breoganii]PML38996.1 hypothetical protein BCT78_04745 [Vibrio breoganii]PMO26327.1 hypothetical protein BCT14_15295 [Vibrio breoganii]PMO30931.1 hypothetical protein BCT13_13030 [Vibrio breoganii]
MISVIIPVYNVEPYIEECLDSLLAQDFNNFELIIVNDGSIDSSMVKVERYRSMFDNMIIIDQENKGLSCARNKGIENATQEYIIFLDSDDWFEKDTFSKCLSLFDGMSDLDLIMFNGRAFSDGYIQNIENFDYERGVDEGKRSGLVLFNEFMSSGHFIAQSCCYIYRRKAFSSLRFMPGIIHEDKYFTAKLLLKNKQTYVIKSKLFNRRVRQNSIMTSKVTMKNAQGYYDTVDRLLREEYEYHKDDEAFKKYISSNFNAGLSAEIKAKTKLSLRRKIKLLRECFNLSIGIKAYIKILLPTLSSRIVR